MSDGGKGSKPRPFSVSDLEYATRWDAIFATDQKAKQERALDEMVRISQEMGSEKKPLEVTNPNIALRPDFDFESLTDRPQDWKFSHWWTGE